MTDHETFARGLFSETDTDGSGLLDKDEIRVLARKMGHRLSDEELDQWMEAIDTDKSGEVDFEEFYTWFSAQSYETSEWAKAAEQRELDYFFACIKGTQAALLKEMNLPRKVKSRESFNTVHVNPEYVDASEAPPVRRSPTRRSPKHATVQRPSVRHQSAGWEFMPEIPNTSPKKLKARRRRSQSMSMHRKPIPESGSTTRLSIGSAATRCSVTGHFQPTHSPVNTRHNVTVSDTSASITRPKSPQWQEMRRGPFAAGDGPMYSTADGGVGGRKCVRIQTQSPGSLTRPVIHDDDPRLPSLLIGSEGADVNQHIPGRGLRTLSPQRTRNSPPPSLLGFKRMVSMTPVRRLASLGQIGARLYT